MEVRQITVGQLETNCYIAASGKKCVVVDPGGCARDILAKVNESALEVESILLTHGHFDHFLAAGEVQAATGAPVLVGAEDVPFLKDPGWMGEYMPKSAALPRDVRPIREGDVVTVGAESLSVIHTPGHSPGSSCFRAPEILFSGDLIFRRDVGRTDLPGGDDGDLMRSLERIMKLPDSTTIYPGHGPSTTVGYEKARNPYLT